MELVAIYKGHTNIESGVSQNGQNWKRTTMLLQTIENRPREVAITCSFKMVDELAKHAPGTTLKVKCDADSHEYQGKYYTELRAWAIQPAYQPQPAAANQPAAEAEASTEAEAAHVVDEYEQAARDAETNECPI